MDLVEESSDEHVLPQLHLAEGGAQLDKSAVILRLEPINEDLLLPHLFLHRGVGQLVHYRVRVSGVDPKKQLVVKHGNFREGQKKWIIW